MACCPRDCADWCDCSCHDDYDADELGLDPEDDVERRAQNLRLQDRAALELLRRPTYPGEILED